MKTGMKIVTIGVALLVAPGAPFEAQAQLAITEVMAQGNLSCLTPDWWELTNFGTNDINLHGYTFRDSGKEATPNVFSNLTIHARESIIFLFSKQPPEYSVTNEAQFRQWWGEDRLPTDLQILLWQDPGFHGVNGDQVWLFGPASNVVDMVRFGRSFYGHSFDYDPETGLFGDVSLPGVKGAWQAATCPHNPDSMERDVGSPGSTTGPVPLSIIGQPLSQTNDGGADVTFCVLAGGLPRPRYQWQFHGTNLPATTAAVTAACLSIPNIQAEHAGPYRVIVNNGFQELTSAPAWLTVNTNPSCPVLDRPLVDTEVFCWQTALFSNQARAYPPPRYQWQSNGVDIAGATNRTLVISNATIDMSGMEYCVQVWNALGATSACATLTVTRKPLLKITEVMACPNHEVQLRGTNTDWFELTNFDVDEVNLQGYRFAESEILSRAFTITQALVLSPGESVVFVQDISPERFRRWWGAENLWPRLQICTYSGFNLNCGGEKLYVWNAAATDPYDSVAYAEFVPFVGVSLEFDHYCVTDCGGDGCIAGNGHDSVVGVNGAFRAAESIDVGSPGYTANPPPRFLQLSRDAFEVGLRCRAVEGKSYRLEYKHDLSDSAWIALPSQVATNSMITLRDTTAGAAARRFYRLDEVP